MTHQTSKGEKLNFASEMGTNLFYTTIKRNHDNNHSRQNTNSSIEIIKGDARDYTTILSVTENCTAVMSTLGQPKGEPPIFSTASANIIRAMIENQIKRYIVVTGLSIDVPLDRKGLKTALASA